MTERELQFENLLEAAPDAMVVVDNAGRIVLVNSQTETLFGYHREELLGRNVELLLPDRFRERHRRHRKEFFGQPRVRPMGANLELLGLTKKGSEFPVEVSLSPIATEQGVLVMSTIRDITQRKLSDEARFWLAAIVESSDDAIISKTPVGTILSWNVGAQRIFGYTQAEAVGKSITILVPRELWDEENSILEKLRGGERIDHYETLRITKAGEKVNVSLTISPVRDLAGKVVRISSIARDITNRKRTEEARRASDERMRLAQLAARLGTFEWNARTGVNTWTPELEAMYGLLPGNFGGTRAAFENLIHPDDRDRVKESIDLVLRTGQPGAGEWRAVWSDGSVHWIAGRWQLFEDETGEPSRIIGVNADITERKRAEEELRESEARFHSAAEAGSVYAYEYHPQTNTVIRSPEYEKVLGLEKDPLTYQQFLNRIHPADRQKFQDTVAALTPENPTSEITYRFQRPTGGIVWLKSKGRGFFDNAGRTIRIVGMVADVSDHKRAEEAMSTVNSRLIQAQEQERSRIARELHDDIAQRLALVSVAIDQVKESLPESLPQVRKQMDELQRQLSDTSSDVQAVSHELHSSTLDVLGLVKASKSWCAQFSKRQMMEVNCHADDLSIALPKEISLCLFRVLQETVHNAAKHSSAKRVNVQLWRDSDAIHLVVSDLGIGFDVAAAKQSGGLGLTSIEERVRIVKGTIQIDSKPMGGTTIHARVPFDSMQAFRQQAV